MPTHAPTGSSEVSIAFTHIFALLPGSLDEDFISIIPSYISGTSWVNNLSINLGWALDKNICWPLGSLLTSKQYALILSPALIFSLGIISFFWIMASVLPRSTITLPNSSRFTIPLKIVSFLSIKSLNCLSLSASLTLKLITCFAVWAAILPKSNEGRGCRISSPICLSLFNLLSFIASTRVISKFEFSGFSTINNFLNIPMSPLSLLISTLISLSVPNFDFAALAIPVSIDPIISSLSIDFSRATASAILNNSNLSALLFNIFF